MTAKITINFEYVKINENFKWLNVSFIIRLGF